MDAAPHRHQGVSDLSPQDLAAFHRGDEAVFRRLVERHTPRLLAFVSPFAVDSAEAHDLVQDTWHRVFVKRVGYAGAGSFQGWLLAVCRNVCLAAVRRRREVPGTPEVVSEVADRRANVDLEVERRDMAESLHGAIMGLPERERDVVILRLVEGRSTRETAARLLCAEGTVKAALHHAIKKLRNAMEVWRDEVVSRH